MAALIFDLDVWVEDQDEPVKIKADQRDMAKFEAEHKISFKRGLDEIPMVFFRTVGLSSIRRTGLKIDESKIIEIELAGDEDPNPGSPAAPAGPSST